MGEEAPIGSIQLVKINGSSRNCGSIAVSIPGSLNFDESGTVYLAYSAICDIEEVIENINDSFDGRMKASLVGQGIFILPETPEVQAVKKNAITKWSWFIKPQEQGDIHLSLVLSHLLKIDGEDTPHVFQQFKKELKVKTEMKKKLQIFWSNYWQWILGTLAGLIVAGVKVWLYFKNQKNI